MSQKATNSETIANIFNSRKIILELAGRRGFNTEEYDNFSINEIGILYANKQLDMLITNEETIIKMIPMQILDKKIKCKMKFTDNSWRVNLIAKEDK